MDPRVGKATDSLELLLFGRCTGRVHDRLRHRLAKVVCLGRIYEFCTLSRLAKRFQHPEPLPELLVMRIDSPEDVEWLVANRDRFDGRFLILILPGQDRHLFGRCCLLFPRFVTYAQSDFSDLAAVIEQQCRKLQNAAAGEKGAESARYHGAADGCSESW